jgi:hypothetical protein
MSMRLNTVIRSLFCLVTGLSSTSLVAQVTLPVGNMGSTSFEDGTAGPGLMVSQYISYYDGGQMKDSNGNKTAGTNNLTTTVPLEHVAYYSNHRVLGGLYGVEALVPFVDVGLNSVHAGNNRTHGIGDLTVSPLMLLWNPKNLRGRMFFQRATFDIVVPTGKYSDQRALNPGSNIVSINPWYAVTFYPQKNSTKWEVTSRVHYLWNSENDSPFVGYGFKSTQPGQAFHQNYAASYEVTPSIRVGFNGYAVEQFTDHKINGHALLDSHERVFGSGPGVQLGGRGLWFYAYFESGAQNTSQGTRVNFRVMKTFGGPPHPQGPPPSQPGS